MLAVEWSCPYPRCAGTQTINACQVPVRFLIRHAFKPITSETCCVLLRVKQLACGQITPHTYSTAHQSTTQSRSSETDIISGCELPQTAHRPLLSKRRQMTGNTANSLSVYWSAAHFSFHNNNAERVLFAGPAGAWMTWVGNRPSNYSFLSSFQSCPTIAHRWRYWLLNAGKIPAQQ